MVEGEVVEGCGGGYVGEKGEEGGRVEERICGLEVGGKETERKRDEHWCAREECPFVFVDGPGAVRGEVGEVERVPTQEGGRRGHILCEEGDEWGRVE